MYHPPQYTGKHSSTENDIIATIANFDPSIPSTVENLLAYRPNYTDVHMSGLAGMFINGIEGFICSLVLLDHQNINQSIRCLLLKEMVLGMDIQ